jgi:hypothetical protein
MNDGSNQDNRYPRGLEDTSTLVDDRDLATLLAMVRENAAALKFRSTNRAADGNWATLLDQDESFLIGRISALRLDQAERAFLDDDAAGRKDEMMKKLIKLSEWLQEWRHSISALESAGGRELCAQLDFLYNQIITDPERIDLSRPEKLRTNFFKLLEALRGQRQLATKQLAASLSSGDHDPGAALLLATAQTFGQIQTRINAFSARLVDFYYHDCLGLGPRAAEPDHVHLTFRRDPFFELPTIVHAGQAFEAGKTSSGEPIVFTADDDLIVNDADVAMLRSIRCQRDPFISPECSFDMITRITSADLAANIGTDGGRRPTVAALGGDVPGLNLPVQHAEIGIAVASPILWMAEGEREVGVLLSMRCRSLKSIENTLRDAKNPRQFAQALGQLFATWLFVKSIDEKKMTEIIDLVEKSPQNADIKRHFCAIQSDPSSQSSASKRNDASSVEHIWRDSDDLLALLLKEEHPLNLKARRDLARAILFKHFFRIEMSSPTGWFEVSDPIHFTEPDEPFAQEDANSDSDENNGLRSVRGEFGLKLLLRHGDPAIVAPSSSAGEWQTPDPVLRLTIAEQSQIYPLSLFDDVELESIVLTVEVSGLRNVELHNQLGKLDPSKPFLPFGSSPGLGAFLVIGSPELAAKQLTEYHVNLEWTGLPQSGFAEYYRFYPSEVSDADFTLRPSFLRDGIWIRAGASSLEMFNNPVGVASPMKCISLDSAALVTNWRTDNSATPFGQSARNGFVKLAITGPAQGFGETQYNAAIATAFSAKPKGWFRTTGEPIVATPQPPFVPRLSGLSVTYKAQTTIAVGTEAGSERIYQIQPFGMRTIHPSPVGSSLPTIFAKCDHSGQLLIGLRSQALAGPLTLYFEMRPDTAMFGRDESDQQTQLAWAYLADDEWKPLQDARVISDTTRGFLRSGVVKLDLPDGLTSANSVLPSGLYWLRVASSDAPHRLAGLRGIGTQALRATRKNVDRMSTPLPAGSISLKSASIRGITGLNQPEPSFGLRLAEDHKREHTRNGERLRHKGRAVTTWDYERLILEEFPHVYKVKCLANLSAKTKPAPDDAPGKPLRVHPGQVLVVVVPTLPLRARGDMAQSTRSLQIDGWEMKQIKGFLSQRTPPGVNLEVINATYERLQVRCSVKIDPKAQQGVVLKRINDSIIRHLSPWCDEGLRTSFDWEIRTDDIYAAIRAADENIKVVTGISLIRVWEDDRLPDDDPNRMVSSYLLDDSAMSADRKDKYNESGSIRAQRPWSLPIPFNRHIVEIVDEPRDATRTGIAAGESAFDDAVAGLQIGETFIIDETSPSRGTV